MAESHGHPRVPDDHRYGSAFAGASKREMPPRLAQSVKRLRSEKAKYAQHRLDVGLTAEQCDIGD